MKSTAIFYSEKSNANLGSIVKNILNYYDYYTIYVRDIDDIILKKFTQINFLVLDLIGSNLDNKSFELINKLVNDGFIKRLLVIKGNNESLIFSSKNTLVYNTDINLNLSNKIKEILAHEVNTTKFCDSSWVKIIGDYLLEIGFSLKHEGYSMMIDSVVYIMSNNCIVTKLNKDLYVFLANKYNKKVSCVEMNIRKSIKMAYERNKNFPFGYCPTNKEFITHMITQLYDKIFIKKVI